MVIPLRDNAPTYDVPWVNLSIIGACILVFIWQVTYPGGIEPSLYLLGEIPARILAGEPIPGTGISSAWTMLTAVFMHADFFHILANMYILWLLGDNVEWVMGRWRYLAFYLICGLVASLVCLVLGPESELPGIGASGAIAGVMGAYLLTYPRARITSLVWWGFLSFGHIMTGRWLPHLRNISSYWFVGSWIAFQLLYSFGAIGLNIRLNLGIYAHAGGAIAGLLLVRLFSLNARIPNKDHHTQTDPLTSVIIGDEGDGGEGAQPVNSLSEELERLRGSRSRKRMLEGPPFRDSIAAEMANRGGFNEAIAHCQDMLAIAEKEFNTHRAKGYREQIEEIRELAGEAAEPKRRGYDRWT